MLSIRFDMPLWLMGLYGGIMTVCVLLLRLVLGKRLPKRVFPVLLAVILVRLFVPFSISSPLSLHIPLLGEASSSKMTALWNIEQRTTAQTPATEEPPEEKPLLLDINAETSTIDQTVEEEAQAFSSPSNYSITITWLGILWAAGAAGSAVWLILRWRKCQKVLQDSEPVSNQTAENVLQKCKVSAAVYTCDYILSPMAAGTIHPEIFLPTRMDFQNRELLEHIVTHEAMHIKYRDNWMKLFMLAALCLHWYNPLVWLMARELNRDLESACDEASLSALDGDSRKSYACSLMAMAVPIQRASLMYSSFSKNEVERRIKAVLSYKKAGKILVSLTAFLAVGTSAVFATGGTTFYDSGLCWGIHADGCFIEADVTLSRDVNLGEFAQGRANSTVYKVLAESVNQGKGRSQVETEIAEALSKEFNIEPGAFRVQSYLSIPREVVLEQYAELGISVKDGRYYYEDTLVHSINDQEEGEATYTTSSSWPDGGVDLYIIRDESGAIKQDGFKAFLWYKF